MVFSPHPLDLITTTPRKLAALHTDMAFKRLITTYTIPPASSVYSVPSYLRLGLSLASQPQRQRYRISTPRLRRQMHTKCPPHERPLAIAQYNSNAEGYWAPPGRKYWGFTIYRCTHGDNEAWSQLMSLLYERAKKNLDERGNSERLESLDLTVHEDASRFVGASTMQILDYFRQWVDRASVKEAYECENAVPILIQDSRARPPFLATTPRYHFCLHVDEASLYTIIDRETKVPKMNALQGHINVINHQWRGLPDEEEQAAIREEDPDQDPLDDDEEPIEGLRVSDVGWMKMDLVSLWPGSYPTLDMAWEHIYTRPPVMPMY